MIYTSKHSNLSDILGASEDIDTPKNGSDRYLMVAVIALMIVGVLAVYSSIAYFAESKSTTAFSLVSNHIFKLGLAFFILLIFSKINYHTLAKLSRFGIVLSWVLLIAVLIFGTEQFGAKRWLSIGGLSFQPSTFATAALLLHVCVLLSEKQDYIKSLGRSFTPIFTWIFITCLLIGIQDFSTAGILFGICFLIMFVGRINLLHLGTLIIMGLLGAILLIQMSDNRKSRIDDYLAQVKNIESSEILRGSGYQAQQAHIAIAKGELFGVGIGKSSQRDFLPAPYNDFIFAIIAEEYGIFGSMTLILIFTLILIRGVVFISKNAEDTLGSLLALGCTLTIVLYGFVNAGVASGLLPVTGLPMPFVSYGGTNMIFAGLLIGILLNISKHHKDRRVLYHG